MPWSMLPIPSVRRLLPLPFSFPFQHSFPFPTGSPAGIPSPARAARTAALRSNASPAITKRDICWLSRGRAHAALLCNSSSFQRGIHSKKLCSFSRREQSSPRAEHNVLQSFISIRLGSKRPCLLTKSFSAI